MSEEQYSESKDVGRKISFFEKLLPIWIIMCMALDFKPFLLGQGYHQGHRQYQSPTQ